MMRIYYENSAGETIDLMTDKVFIPDPETLFENNWNYTAAMRGDFGKVKRLFKEMSEMELDVQIIADNQKDFTEILERMHDVFERDIFLQKEGKIYCGKYYRKCFVIAKVPEEWDAVMDSISIPIRILAHPFWVKEIKNFFTESEEYGQPYLDYPSEFPYDYSNDVVSRYINVPGVRSANFELKIGGPCTNPAVTIGPQTYQVNIDLRTGEYLVIDTSERVVKKIGVDGQEENCFDNRSRDFSDFFAKIPAGNPFVSWNGNYRFKLTLKIERSEPEWA